MTENEIGKVVVDAALKEHRELGPGLLEMVSEEPLGVFASLRETRSGFEQGGAANAAPPPR